MQPVEFSEVIARAGGDYMNTVLSPVNDHVVRLSVMHEGFYWHRHPYSDESFLVLEGRLLIEFEDHAVELEPGRLLTVPAGVIHRTSPIGGRTVNLTFEKADAESEEVEPPHGARDHLGGLSSHQSLNVGSDFDPSERT